METQLMDIVNAGDLVNWDLVSNLHFNEEGKHIINFDDDFPLLVKLVRLHYNQKLTPNYHDYLELTYIFDGRGTFHVRNKIYDVNQGDLTVISAGELHTFTANYEKPLRLLSLFFLPELYHRSGQELIDFELIRPILNKDTDEIDCLSSKLFDSAVILEMFTTISTNLASETMLGRIKAKNLLAGILIELLKQHAKVPLSRRRKYDKKEIGSKRLAKVFRFVNENYADKISLNDAAEFACMSPNYFCRYFKKVTGNTFTEYVMRLRIDKAKKLLLTYDYPKKNIAFQVGFDNISYFYRIFHRFTHLTPSEFVEKHRDLV